LREATSLLEAAVIGALGVRRKTAAGKLAHLEVVGDALAADPLAVARLVAAVAALQVAFLVAFHHHRSLPWF